MYLYTHICTHIHMLDTSQLNHVFSSTMLLGKNDNLKEELDLRKCFDTTAICIEHGSHLLSLKDKSILHMLQHLSETQSKATLRCIQK